MNYDAWIRRHMSLNQPCERCGAKWEYKITPCMSKVCGSCADYLLGE